MFFWLSKMFWMLATPLNALWILMVIGFLISGFKARWKISFLRSVVLAFLLLGFFPVGPNLMVLLERQYERPSEMPANIDGVIVLGGAFNSHLSEKTDMLAPNGNIGRIIDFIDLMKRYPKVKHVFSGGSGHILQPHRKEADDAEMFFEVVGANTENIIFESRSKTTYENALFSQNLVEPSKDEMWILVTSAFHLPRAVGVFQEVGWRVIPYPSGPKTDGKYRLLPQTFNVLGNYYMLSQALKEFIGTFIYFITDKSALPLPLSSLQSIESNEKRGE